jgi:hypothetical protein
MHKDVKHNLKQIPVERIFTMVLALGKYSLFLYIFPPWIMNCSFDSIMLVIILVKAFDLIAGIFILKATAEDQAALHVKNPVAEL